MTKCKTEELPATDTIKQVPAGDMKQYVGTKKIYARHCTADEADEILDRKVCRDNADTEGNGYLVQYKDGYTSWSPAGAFEEAYDLTGYGCSVRERIIEITDLMNEMREFGVSATPGEVTGVEHFSLLVKLQEQKSELSMFLENRRA